jgi:hypothetical protein
MLPATDDESAAAASSGDAAVNPGVFLAGVAGLLRETVQRFETISGGVTDAVMSRAGMADRELIVTLQAFDRLQQEFIAVADVLSRYSGALGDPSRNGKAARIEDDAIAMIAVSDLKARLLRHLQSGGSHQAETPPPGEEIF